MGKIIKNLMSAVLCIAIIFSTFGIYGFAARKFTVYKAQIVSSKVYARSKPDLKSKINKTYYKGNIVEITGQTGKYLKTKYGYIYASYAKRYNPPAPKPKDKYVRMLNDTPLMLEPNGNIDERVAVKGKVFKVLEEKGDFYKVKLGKINGYIPRTNGEILKEDYVNKITLGWNEINYRFKNEEQYKSSDSYISKSSYLTGLDAISPTWFSIGGDGSKPETIALMEIGDIEYVKMAHKNGYEVWPRLYDYDAQRCSIMFKNEDVRKRIIDEIVNFSIKYNLDGINVDIEGIGSIPENKDGFTLFVGELSKRLKEIGLTVSVDVTKIVPSSRYSNFYDRPALAKAADYLIFMGYDETSMSLKSWGPCASFKWVESGIKDMIAQGVPAEKLILGVPFYMTDYAYIDIKEPFVEDTVYILKDTPIYTEPLKDDSKRIGNSLVSQSFKYVELTNDKQWYKIEYKNGTENITAYVHNDDSVMVRENTLIAGYDKPNIKTVADRMKNYQVTFIDDGKVSGQKIIEYTMDNLKHRTWLEDKESMSGRMDMVNKYGLAGMGGWRLYGETSEIWDVIKLKLKK